MLLRKIFQHILRGGDGLAFAAAGRGGQAQIGEEHFAELLGRVDVEAPSGQLEDALADALQLDGEALGEAVEHAEIDAHAGLLHAEEDRRERQVDLCVDARDAGLFDFGLAVREPAHEWRPRRRPAWTAQAASGARPHRPATAWRGWD